MTSRVELKPIYRELYSALRDRSSYRPWANTYAMFGLIWGLPIPVVCLAIDLLARGQSITAAGIVDCFWIHPIHFLFLLHPPAFLIIFGAMGTVRRKKEEQIHSLMDQLQEQIQELELAHDRLKILDELKDEFLANVTHELKTPLVSSSGYTEMILKEMLGPITDKQRRGLNVSLKNLRRLERQINDLLDFARIESGNSQIYRVPVDLQELFDDVAATLQPAIESANMTLAISEAHPGLSISADRDALRSVLVNLIENAIKFTDEGGTIRVQARGPEQGRLIVEVIDNGIGIPADALPYVFERFRQVDGNASRRFSGAGLGLAIVKRFVEAHGGQIDVESRTGEGTCVRFWIPAEPVEAQNAHVTERTTAK